MESARRHLREKGLLEGAPTLESEGNLDALAPAMERYCGLEPGSIVKVEGDALTFDPVNQGAFEDIERVSCLWAVMQLSGVTKFGFVGNGRGPLDDE